MRTKLTPAFVQKASAEAGKDRSIFWDDAMEGFGLMVTASGHRSFVCQYRTGSKSRRYTLKRGLSLDAARREGRAILGLVARGGDPVNERRRAADAKTNTLRAVAAIYLEREANRLRSIGQRRNILERLVFPKLGARQIETIKRSEIVRLLDHVEKVNGPVMADQTLATVRRLFNWHAARSDDFLTPITRGMSRTRPQERKRQRILNDDEIRAVWLAASDGSEPFDYLLRFILLTATRRSESAEMPRAELNGAEWLIPAARHKSKSDFLLPLSAKAAKLLEEMPARGKKLFFTTDGQHPLGGFSKFKRAFDARSGVTGWTLHDLRRTARSLMSRAGVPPDHAERAIGHTLVGIRGTYDVHSYRDEKHAALEALARQLERIVNPTQKVVDLRERVPM